MRKFTQKGIRTFAFVGPLLPGDPEKLVGLLEGKTDKIYIDKMNYLFTIRRFYQQHALEKATTDKFFLEYKERLINELKKTNALPTLPLQKKF